MTTCPEPFRAIHLGRCRSTSDYIKENFPRLEKDLPLMVSAGSQSGGRGREGRPWFSAAGKGVYATFAFPLADLRGLSLLSLAAGIAACDMLADWSGKEFSLKWPNDVMAGAGKVAGILCENLVAGEKITCLVGIGLNLNQLPGDFPEELRARAASLRMLTGSAWPVAEGRRRLARSLDAWRRRLEADPGAIVDRARRLTRSAVGREIVFRLQGREWRGTCRGLAADGGLILETAGRERSIHYSGEIIG